MRKLGAAGLLQEGDLKVTAPNQTHDSFTISRMLPHRRERVWAAWSERAKKREWLGQADYKMDFRPGGYERGVVVNAKGRRATEARFFEILERRRIVLASSISIDDRVLTVALATILFEDAQDGTLLTYVEQTCMLSPTEAIEERKHSWSVLFDLLAAYLTAEAGNGALS